MKKSTIGSKSGAVPDYYSQKTKAEKKVGRKLSNKEFEEKYLVLPENESTMGNANISIFDPALAEIIYLWFSNPGDSVLDPFAGGSVRGIVAAETGRNYVGVDLREEQVEANRENAEQVCKDIMPVWICGDSIGIKKLAPGEYDFVLTCPPYGDLEIYSDDERDLSNMSNDEFDKIYFQIMKTTADMLKKNRFAAVVVGNYRDKNGFLRDLCGLTINAMEAGGARYYNEMIYLQPIGSMPTKITRQFNGGRKVGKIHQNVLIFCKGDWKEASNRLEKIVIPDVDEE